MSNVKVAVRVRPLDQKEIEQGARVVVEVHGEAISVHNPKLQGISSEFGDSRERVKHFHYDFAYWSEELTSPEYASQEMIFQDLGTEVLQAAFDGYNACIFAYGQTGSGKTHTMMGYPPGQLGLIPRICEGLFSRMDQIQEEEEEERSSFRVVVSYLEIYNERVRDLLGPNFSKQHEKYTLRVREHPRTGPYVQDLSQHQVKDKTKIQALIERGNDNRTTAATHMHDKSSRSHAIFTITFTQAHLDEDLPSEKISRLHLVDLAGSERADPTSKYNRGRLKEGANINKSLVTLGNVIQALAERSLREWNQEGDGSLRSTSINGSRDSLTSPGGSPRRRSLFIPYRDSVLTWLLKDSLGGNAKTIMVATISPSSMYYSETISTLRYAQRAKSIMNKPYINEDPNVKIIRELRAEIVRLRTMLASHWQSEQSPDSKQFKNMETQVERTTTCDVGAGSLMSLSESSSGIYERLEENENKARELTKCWFDKWGEAHEIMMDSDMRIRPLVHRSNSMGVIVDSQLPHLICMDDDILATGVLMYYLREGQTVVGNGDAALPTDIEVNGPGTVADHCVITHDSGEVCLEPGEDAYITVNKEIITDPVCLSQGDIICLGHNNMFRFNNPQEAAILREQRMAQYGHSKQPGALSRCSSMSSISNSDVGEREPIPNLTPRTSLVRGLDFERQHSTEAERLQAAREELAKLADEEEVLLDAHMDSEEDMYRMHELHRADVEEQKRHLQALIEQHERDHATAQHALDEMRKQLEKERKRRSNNGPDLHEGQQTVQAEVHHLQELERSESMRELSASVDSSLGTSGRLRVQEDVAMEIEVPSGDRASASGMSTSSTDTQGLLGLADVYGAEIFRLKDALEGQRQEMVAAVAAAEEEWHRKEEDLARREQELEQMFLASSERLQLEQQHLKEKEQQFKTAETGQLQKVAAGTDSLSQMQHRQQQLRMYIEHKEKELDPDSQRIEPLGESASEESLGSSLGSSRGRRRSPVKQKKALAKTIDPADSRSTHSRSSPFTIFATSRASSKGSQSPSASSAGARPKEHSSPSTPSESPSPKPKKMSLAEKVTARLYKPSQSKKRAESADAAKGKEGSPASGKKDSSYTRSKSAPALPLCIETKKKKVPTATLR